MGSDKVIREVKIGVSLADHVHNELIKLLREYVDIFAWSYQYMPSLDTNIVEHHFCLVFSFMDYFSGYNQIKMVPDNMEKTTFITSQGTYSYKVMSFGLKNAGATYQCAMMSLFHDMPHKEIKVYADDMISKSKTEDDHLDHMRKLFSRLLKFKLRLNPAKCVFGVHFGKLLGFIVSQKGIEVNPDKVRAIQDMASPKT